MQAVVQYMVDTGAMELIDARTKRVARIWPAPVDILVGQLEEMARNLAWHGTVMTFYELLNDDSMRTISDFNF